MGRSDPTPNRSYRFADHARYLDAWFDGLKLDRKVTLVLHDSRRTARTRSARRLIPSCEAHYGEMKPDPPSFTSADKDSAGESRP